MRAAKILPNVSQHILNSVPIFLLASAGTDQKPSLLLKVLSKSRDFCPHPSSSQPSQGCSQNQPLGKCSDWRVKQKQPCGTWKAAWTRQFPRALSTSEEIIPLTGEAVRSKLLSEAKGFSKRVLKPSSWLCLGNSLLLSSAFLKTRRKAAMHKHFYHCLSIPKVSDTARRSLSMDTMQS